MSTEEETCGQELARSAEVPERLARLFAHVAENMDAHASWVGRSGAGSPPAEQERQAMQAAAAAYRKIAEAASEATTLLRSLRELPAAPHNPADLDRPALAGWMAVKIEMQRAFAQLLLEHAAESERALAGMR